MVSHSCDSLICCLADKKNQPAEQGIGGRSKIGVRIWATACWTIRSTTVGIPSFLTPPLGFGISGLTNGEMKGLASDNVPANAENEMSAKG